MLEMRMSPDETLTFLDECIKFWRRKKREAVERGESGHTEACYVDAFQSMRISLFGELLSLEQ